MVNEKEKPPEICKKWIRYNFSFTFLRSHSWKYKILTCIIM